LVEINGEVVSASPIFDYAGTENNFAAPLASGALAPTNEIRVAVMVDGQIAEIEIVRS
jgi:hypothetical protein